MRVLFCKVCICSFLLLIITPVHGIMQAFSFLLVLGKILILLSVENGCKDTNGGVSPPKLGEIIIIIRKAEAFHGAVFIAAFARFCVWLQLHQHAGTGAFLRNRLIFYYEINHWSGGVGIRRSLL